MKRLILAYETTILYTHVVESPCGQAFIVERSVALLLFIILNLFHYGMH